MNIFHELMIVTQAKGILNPAYLPLLTVPLTGLLSLFAAYCGFRWNSAASERRERQLSEERLISSNLKTRQDAYAKIYEELCECRSYYEKFIESGNEFKEHEEEQNFGPLDSNTVFLKAYRKHEIWIHQSTKQKFKLLFQEMSIMNNIALLNALHRIKIENGEEEGFGLHDVQEGCHRVLDVIDDLREHIVNINGLGQLDKHTDLILS